MKKEPKSFRWIRAVRAEIDRDTKGMTEKEWIAYHNARAQKARDSLPKFTPEEAERIIHAALYSEDEPAPSRKVTASRKPAPSRKTVAAKTPARRRKVSKRLAHA